MKNYRVFLILLLCFFINQEGRCQSSGSFFFIQITDPQFGFIDDNKSFGKETELYEKAVAEVNRLKPSFVVITGDLVNIKDDKAQTEEFKRITSLISRKIPVYYSPGNHDIGQAPEQKDLDEFIKNYGHDRFSFSKKKSLFIGLNSCLIKSATPVLERAQFEWLKEELSKGKKMNNIVLFCHYPFFTKIADEPDAYFNIPLEIRNRYLSLLKKSNVKAVFAGHLHNNSIAKDGVLDMVTTSAVGKPLSTSPSGIRVIKVYPSKIVSEYYSLDKIPAVITMNDN